MKPHLTNVIKRFKEAVTEIPLPGKICCVRSTQHLSEAGQEAACQLLLRLHPEQPEVIADACTSTAGPDPCLASFCHLLHVLTKCRLFCGGRLYQIANAKCQHI